MDKFFQIYNVSKPSSVNNNVKIDNEKTNSVVTPSFTNIVSLGSEQITTQPKLLSVLPTPIISQPLPKVNVTNVSSTVSTTNKILSTVSNEPLQLTPSIASTGNVIIPQTAFNKETLFFGQGDSVSLTAISPLDISENIISLNNSTVTPGVYTLAQITVDEKGIIQDASSGIIPPNEDWSNFPAISNVDMSGNLIKNLGAPVDNNDATTKQYVNTAITTLTNDISGSYVNLTTAQDISGVKTFLNVPISATLPTANNEIANKEYVDTEITTLTNDISGSYVNLTTAQDISGVKTFFNVPVCATLPTTNDELTNKLYVDSAVSGAVGSYLPLAGGTMAGNIDMSGNDLLNVGTLTAGGVTESTTFGSAIYPMASHDVYATNVSMNSYNPISAMNFIGIGGVNINAPDNDINLNAGDINLTQTQTTSFMNLTAAGAIVAAAGGAVDITAGGAVAINAGATIQILAPGNVSIGSGNVLGADTEIEKVGFLDNKIYKAGTADLEVDNVSKLQNTGGNMLINSSNNVNITATNNVDISASLITTSTLPQCAVVPSIGNQLVNKTYVDGYVKFTPTSMFYVAKNGNDTTGYGTILNPWLTIQHAITAVETAGTGGIINITPGTYTENLTIVKNINLYGAPVYQANADNENPSPAVNITGNIQYAPTVGISSSLNNLLVVGRVYQPSTNTFPLALSINNCEVSKNVTLPLSTNFVQVNTGSLVITESIIKNTTLINNNFLVSAQNNVLLTIFNSRLTGNSSSSIVNATTTLKMTNSVITNTRIGGLACYIEIPNAGLITTLKDNVFNLNNAQALLYISDVAHSIILDSNTFVSSYVGALIDNPDGTGTITITLERSNSTSLVVGQYIAGINCVLIDTNYVGTLSATASGNSGQHLSIMINGVVYKISLLLP